jgi:hypothetical protein
MSLRTNFTDSEWSTLEKTPVWAFNLTAACDGKIDPKEIEAFAKELGETMQYKDELAREVFFSLVTRLDQVLPTCIVSPTELVTGLESAGRIVDSKSPTHAAAFKRSVLLICKNVAEASGGSRIWGGKKTSDEEATAMRLIAIALNL